MKRYKLYSGATTRDIEAKIDYLSALDHAYHMGFSRGAEHGVKWATVLYRTPIDPFPKENRRSDYRRLQKHYEKQMKRMK